MSLPPPALKPSFLVADESVAARDAARCREWAALERVVPRAAREAVAARQSLEDVGAAEPAQPVPQHEASEPVGAGTTGLDVGDAPGNSTITDALVAVPLPAPWDAVTVQVIDRAPSAAVRV